MNEQQDNVIFAITTVYFNFILKITLPRRNNCSDFSIVYFRTVIQNVFC